MLDPVDATCVAITRQRFYFFDYFISPFLFSEAWRLDCVFSAFLCNAVEQLNMNVPIPFPSLSSPCGNYPILCFRGRIAMLDQFSLLFFLHLTVTGPVALLFQQKDRPFAQLLPGLETGHPVTVGQSPAHESHTEQSETETRKTAFCSSWHWNHMQVTDRPSPDAPSLTQAIIVQMVYWNDHLTDEIRVHWYLRGILCDKFTCWEGELHCLRASLVSPSHTSFTDV